MNHISRRTRVRALMPVLLLAATAVLSLTPAQEASSNDHTNSLRKQQAATKVYDLYIMSLCPYGIQAMAELAELIRAFPEIEWNVWFIGTAEGDRLTSLRGEGEMFDEALWLGIKALYPFRYHEFLFLRAGSQEPTEKLLDEMGVDVDKLRRWAEDAGQSELRKHYTRSMRLGVNASPTLFVDGEEYKKAIGGGRLIRDKCRAANPAPVFCADYPQCSEDSDCEAKGKIGRCVKSHEGGIDRAVCEFRDDVKFTLTVLVADTAMDAPETAVIAAAEELLPGARTEIVKLSSERGKAAAAKFSPDALPFYHFEKAAEGAYRFMSIKDMLVPVSSNGGQGGFTFAPGVTKTNYFPKRTLSPGSVTLYADPLMQDIGRVISALMSDPDIAKRIALRPLTPPRGADGDGGRPASLQDKLRMEEALRWLVLSSDFPKKYHAYLSRYADDPISTYWFNWLKPLGINQKKFLRALEAARPKLALYRDDLSQISAGEPVIFLIDNRMKVTASGEAELERILKFFNNTQ